MLDLAPRSDVGADRDCPYKQVRGLIRGLEILRMLNECPSGSADANVLARQVGLHRTTVRRLLETLRDEGYVRRSASDGSYRLTGHVRRLSDGFTADEWIAEVAEPVLKDLLQTLVWPSDLATPDGDTMVIRESTHRFSPLSFHRGMVGRSLPMLFTATGRAYLAFCPDAERERILDLLRARNDEEGAVARSESAVGAMLRATRENGYGVNDSEWDRERKVAALAVPIRHDGRALGCINVVYVRRAMPIGTAVSRYLPALRAAAARIEGGLV